MAKTCFVGKRFMASSMEVIDEANDIIGEYAAQGYDLTLRQLYYQFVSRDMLDNNQKSYNRLGSIINAARLAGLVDWDTIKDRTRFLRELPHWDSPRDIIDACARQFRIDKWDRQETRCEVWIEKDALVGVIEKVCNDNDVAFFACRGYVSQSFMYEAAQRLAGYEQAGQEVTIFHLGDHDPSGIDMTRDINDRLAMFHRGQIVEVARLALNMTQINDFNPPPNPAKFTDSRAEDYVTQYGSSSWELDALSPRVITGLITDAVDGIRDENLWEEAEQEEQEGRDRISELAEQA